MRERWLNLCSRICSCGDFNAQLEIYSDLNTRYTAPDRHYHNLEHIEACLRELDTARAAALHADAIEMAIWFHDAIYDSHRSDNEEQSAQLAIAACRCLGAAHLCEEVAELIRATNHRAPPTTPDAALLIDIDLSILGTPAAIFDRYELAIRAEYAWVSAADFRTGRAKVLRHFLDRPRLFTTDQFFARCEKPARENLARSLAALSA